MKDTQSSKNFILKAFLLLFGVTCHLTFLAAVSLMIWQLYFGMEFGLVGINKPYSILYDFFLLISFPILHSFFLTLKGRKSLQRLLPINYSSQLSTSIYVFLTSLQLMMIFMLWAPTGVFLFKFSNPAALILNFAFFVSWPLLGLAMFEAGPAVQFGYGGWMSILKGKTLKYPEFSASGLHAICRHPIYLSFFLGLFSSPIWTLDHLIVACTWGPYCLIGPLFKEKRYAKRFGASFLDYCQKVPYFPSFKRS